MAHQVLDYLCIAIMPLFINIAFRKLLDLLLGGMLLMLTRLLESPWKNAGHSMVAFPRFTRHD